MDHTKLVIFLLIVLGTVTTFGSPITEDYPEEYFEGPEEYPELSPDSKELDTLRSDPDMGTFHEMAPNSKELEALLRSDSALGSYPEMVPNNKEQKELLSNSSDQDGKKVKRVFEVVKSLWGECSNVDRTIAIHIDNKSDSPLIATGVYFKSGTSDANVPYAVKSGKALLWNARKTKGSVAGGADGVLTYYILSIGKTIAVMYSVPYNYLKYINKWNVLLYEGKIHASEKIYNDMYDNNPFKGDNFWHSRNLGSQLEIRGAMTGSGTATLKFRVLKSK